MGLTSALNTSVNGLSLNETAIAVIGNNIANADTNGFKSSNVLFTTQLSQTLSVGSGPTATNGGTNPQQIGLGASIATIATDFSEGASPTPAAPRTWRFKARAFSFSTARRAMSTRVTGVSRSAPMTRSS